MSSDEDDWYIDTFTIQFGLQLETAQSRQSYVQDEATRDGRELVLQQLGCSCERLDAQPDRTKQGAQRVEHERIIIDNEYSRLCRS